MKKLKLSIILVGLMVLQNAVKAQITAGGQPASFDSKFQTEFETLADTETLPSPDWKQVEREDAEGPNTRFSTPIKVNFDMETNGEWTDLQNGDRVWRMKLKSPNALAIAVFYDDFFLPQGAKLFMYSPDRKQVKGAYTWRNNRKSRRFWTGLINGDEAVIEYYEPKAVKGEGRLHLFRVDHVYHAANFGVEKTVTEAFGFGASWDCHENVNCSAGDELRDQQRGICRIIVVVEEGMGYCTGNLINNSNRDATPYILSAYHCQDGYTPEWDMYRFDFHYESETCDNPISEPTYNSILGSELIAGRQQSDFTLMKLIPEIPASYNLYFIGWSHTALAPTSTSMIHHPKGDIKKISSSGISAFIHNDAIFWDNDVITPPYYHFQVDFQEGTYEVGSSGAGLLDQWGLIAGQLNGGQSSCDPDTATIGYFGHFTYSWGNGQTPETRLGDWLEPIELETDTLHGMEQPAGSTYSISGHVLTPNGEGIAYATVNIDNPTYGLLQFETDSMGYFIAPDMPAGEEYTIAVDKDFNYGNGVSTADLIRIRKHILGVTMLDSPYKIIGADANNSEHISTIDIIRIQKLILAIQQDFGDNGATSWRFVPSGYQFPDVEHPFDSVFPESGTLPSLDTDFTSVNFVGIKVGDMNDSVNPWE